MLQWLHTRRVRPMDDDGRHSVYAWPRVCRSLHPGVDRVLRPRRRQARASAAARDVMLTTASRAGERHLKPREASLLLPEKEVTIGKEGTSK